MVLPWPGLIHAYSTSAHCNAACSRCVYVAGAARRGGEHACVVNDSSMARQAQQGDIDAYETLMRLHQDIAHRAAYLVTGDAGDAEDAVQEAFVKAWYALGSFDCNRPFRPWLLRIVTNEAHTRRRSVARHTRLALRAMEHARSDAAPSPESAILRATRQRDRRAEPVTRSRPPNHLATFSTLRRPRWPRRSASRQERFAHASTVR